MKQQKEIQNVLVILLGFTLLFFLFHWEGFLWIGGLLGIPALISSSLRNYMLKFWGQVASGLGAINSRIILGLIFFLILTPIALLSRLFSKDKMQLKKKADKASYFKMRNHVYSSEDFENPW